MKILVTDDHALFRQAFINMVNTITAGVCLEAGNGEEALAVLRTHKIDILFLDVSMPVMNGYDACDRIREKYPQVKIIMLTQFDEKDVISHFIQKGVSAFLTKSSCLEDIECALTKLKNGNTYFPRAILEGIQDSFQEVEAHARRVKLSPREKKIIDYLHLGLTSKEIATKIKLNVKTIDGYRERLLTKTQTRNVAELISFAFKRGLLRAG
jgi:two-component system, NarL family, response regulator DegU